MIKRLTNLASSLVNLAPIRGLKNLARSALEKLTFGRGLKIWSSPTTREVKAYKNFYEFKLKNGLTVLFKESKGTEINAKIVINSGSAKDPVGKEGLAHFLEHIVISNTKEFAKEVDDVVKFNGGSMNGMTSNQQTIYPVTLPKDKLDLALRILRAYMTPLNYDEAIIEKEKGIVCSEIKMTEASPQRKSYMKFLEILFGKDHPLVKDTIGTSTSVNSITAKDMEKFHDEEYVPNNATLVISGEFDKYKLKDMVEKYFADLAPRPETKRPDFSQSIKPSEIKNHEIRDTALISSLVQAYKVPKFNHRESLIASILSSALSGGKNSRLTRYLVDGEGAAKPVALIAGASYDACSDYGHYKFFVKPLDSNVEANIKEAESIINRELKDIAANGLDEKEYNRLISEMEASEVYKLDSQHSSLGAIATYHDDGEDWCKALSRLNDIRSITNDDVKNFVAKYLVPENRHSLKVIGKGTGLNPDFLKALKDKMPEKINLNEETKLSTEKLTRVIGLSRGPSNVSTSLHDLQKYKLDNGMSVYLKEDHSLPVVFFDLAFPGGSLAVEDKYGAALGLLSGLLAETGSYNPATKRRLDKKMIEDFETKLGSSFHCGTSMDRGSIAGSCLSKNLDKTLALMNEVLNHPALLETNDSQVVKEVAAEFEKAKKQILDMMEIFKKFPGMKLAEKFGKKVYPEGHMFYVKGFEKVAAEIKAITLDDLRILYKKLYKANAANITVVGDIGRQGINTKLVPFLENWNSQISSPVPKPDYSRIAPVKAPAASLSIVSGDDNSPESTVLIGNPAEIYEDAPDYYPALIANNILGSGLSSRLMAELRENKGLVYRAGSMLQCLKNGCGPFMINLACDPRNVKKSIANVFSVVKKFLLEGVTKAELDLAKSEIKKSFAMHAFNSRRHACSTLSSLMYRGKDESFVNNFNQMIDAITVEEVNAAARKFIKPNNFTIVASKPKDFDFKSSLPSAVKDSNTVGEQRLQVA